jgi:hypothetical protein
MKTYKITWVESSTRNAACLGLDEKIQSDGTLSEVAWAARYHGECAGIDLDRYEPVVEPVGTDGSVLGNSARAG